MEEKDITDPKDFSSSETKAGFWAKLKDKGLWKETIRPRALEILELLSFLGGVTLTALIASGVLALGPVWLGICATLGFLGASHFFGTVSWTISYYENDNGNPWSRGIDDSLLSFIAALKLFFLPVLFLLGGISLILLGSLGVMGLGLGIGLGIPSIVSSLIWFNNFAGVDPFDNKEESFRRGVWISYIAVVGMLAAATFLILGFAGILAWPSVLAFGAPAAIAAIVVPIVGILIKSTNWITFRARVEELLEPVLFFGGIALTVLISLGILPFGGVGMAICSMLTFFSASRFLATNSWSNDHNYNNYEGEEQALIRGSDYDSVYPIKRIISIIGILAGFALPILGATGVFGLGLGLALGIPILSASLIGLVSICMYTKNNNKYMIDRSDNLWSICTAISGVIAAGAFLGLGFGGVLAFPVAVAVAVPSIVFSTIIGLIHLTLFSLSKIDLEHLKCLKEPLIDSRHRLSFLGIGFYKYIKDEIKIDSKAIDLIQFS